MALSYTANINMTTVNGKFAATVPSKVSRQASALAAMSLSPESGQTAEEQKKKKNVS